MDKKKKQVFITTTKEDMADKLKALGFVLVSEDHSPWTFLNDTSIGAKFEEGGVMYTNKLNI